MTTEEKELYKSNDFEMQMFSSGGGKLPGGGSRSYHKE